MHLPRDSPRNVYEVLRVSEVSVTLPAGVDDHVSGLQHNIHVGAFGRLK
jgi:hypothetical protein